MKKIILIFVVFIGNQQLFAQTIYNYQIKDITGNTFDMATLKGKKVMIVNTASECGLTSQYKLLQELYDTYQNQNFVIIGFPANDFAHQEPGNNQEIASFCKSNYGVTFPMMEKISVKGNDMHPLYQFLTEKDKNKKIDSKVVWNFQKYLINTDGTLYQVIKPRTKPNDTVITNWIESK